MTDTNGINILFDVTAPEPEEVEFDGETFEVYGHVMIVQVDWLTPNA